MIAAATLLGAGPAASVTALGFGPPELDGVAEDRQAAADGLPAYRFEGGRDWPALRFHAASPLDWSRASALAIDVDNPGPDPFRLLLRLDDEPGSDGGDRSLTGITEIAPHERITVVLPLDATAPAGMRGLPPGPIAPRPGETMILERRGSVDLGHIRALHISGFRSASAQTVRIGAASLRVASTTADRPKALADPFGQWIAGDWPGKVTSLADLRAKLRQADADTRRLAATVPEGADRFGGVAGGPVLRATGFFRSEKVGGRWTLVTPAGHRFFSLGVDTVAAANPTVVAGRPGVFETLPPEASRSRTYDVGTANLERGLGPDWRARWPTHVVNRLQAWGFNTLGAWSEPAVTGLGRMAHVVFTDVEGGSASVPMTDGRDLPDPFDPRFAVVADHVAAAMTRDTRDDATLLGYFSGNELPWGTADRPEAGVAAHVLAQGGDSPAKRAFIEALRARYGTLGAWTAAWGSATPSWEAALTGPVTLSSPLPPAARDDVAVFEARFADAYFRTVALAIKAHDSHHLYLGTRFASFTPAAVSACARWCDVVSFNVYARTPDEEAAAWRPFDKPVLIGEFHFGSTDRGSFWPGMVPVSREADRGPAYAAYVDAAVSDPQVVGTHWFQYADEPLTGRPYDGENGHIGLVAVTDVPYSGFVEAVAAANRSALNRFATSGVAELRGTQD